VSLANQGGKEAPTAMAVGGTGDGEPPTRPEALTLGDKIGVGTAVIHTLILIVSIFALWYAAKQLTIAVKGTQYQNAIIVVDQSTDVSDQLIHQPKLLDVLENKNSDKEDQQMVENTLDKYQLLLFKASILQENDLMPVEFWKAFIADFCRLYEKYPYIQGWWGRQRTREPYNSLSQRYRDLSYECTP
jgi:hypothetical protein